MAIKKVANTELRNVMGDPWKDGEEVLNLTIALKALLNNTKPLKGAKITYHDDEMALLIAESLRDCKNGMLEFEETPYKWLLEFVRTDGPKLFSPNTALVIRALEAEVKAEA